MNRKQLKQRLASLNRMDLRGLLAEMVDEMAECGDQKLVVAFNDGGKPVAGLALLAAPDISRYLEALDAVESGAETSPEVTEEMTLAGAREWDRAHKLGVRNWLEMVERVYLAMHAASQTKERVNGQRTH